jgi:hypothetical protein
MGTLDIVQYRIGARELRTGEDDSAPHRAREGRPGPLVPVGEVHAVDDDAEAICGQGRMYVIGEEWDRGTYREVCRRCAELAPRR